MSVCWMSKFFIPESTSKKLYTALKEVVEIEMIPPLQKADFGLSSYPTIEKPTPKELAYSPIGIFRREGESEDDILEFIFEERKFPEFHIAFGKAPHEGVLAWGNPYPHELIRPDDSPECYRLSASPEKFRPFALRWPLMSQRDIPILVDSAKRLIPQILDWYATQTVGPNLFGGRNEPIERISHRRQ